MNGYLRPDQILDHLTVIKICHLFQIVYFQVVMSERKIVDSHFHIFDLEVRNNYPNQNPSHGFPSAEQPEINRSFAQFSPFALIIQNPFQVAHDRGGWPGDGRQGNQERRLRPVLQRLS